MTTETHRRRRRRDAALEAERQRELLDAAQTAELLSTTERHVRSMVYHRRIPFVKVGAYLRFDRAELEQWLDAQSVPADGGAA